MREDEKTRGREDEGRSLPVVDATASGLARRDVVRLLAAAPLAAFALTLEDVERAARSAGAALQGVAERGAQFRPKFFTADEWKTVRVLSDIVIPRDARSGSATDAGVPEFMDYIMIVYPEIGTSVRAGLRWLDGESRRSFSKAFVQGTPREQTALLDRIAYPKRAAEAMKPGVEFFSRFRDLTASGFWSSKIGVADLQYVGNRPQAVWNGCPPAALRKLGVSYEG